MSKSTTPESPPTKPTPGRLIPVTDWPRFHPWPPVSGLRHLVFHAQEKGFADCVRRVGRRVLIDEARFFEFVERQNGGPGNG